MTMATDKEMLVRCYLWKTHYFFVVDLSPIRLPLKPLSPGFTFCSFGLLAFDDFSSLRFLFEIHIFSV
jgi:hypothetical protein